MNMLDLEGAVDNFTSAIDLEPTLVDAHFNRAVIFLNLQQFQNTLRGFSQIIEIDPTYSAAYN